MGTVINEIKNHYPTLPYFAAVSRRISEESPITINDLEELYPYASKMAKENKEVMEQARKATADLQNGNKGYLALWKHILKISIEDLQKNYASLNVSFDLWLGESNSQPYIANMINYLKDNGLAFESDGALIVDVSELTDNVDIPPFIVTKSDGAILYSTTDLATIIMRKEKFHADEILYVVDNRRNPFQTIIPLCYKSKIADDNLKMYFVGFRQWMVRMVNLTKLEMVELWN